MHTIVSWPIYIIYILSWNPKKSLNKAREGNRQNIASSGFYKCICDKSEWWPHFEKKGRKKASREKGKGVNEEDGDYLQRIKVIITLVKRPRKNRLKWRIEYGWDERKEIFYIPRLSFIRLLIVKQLSLSGCTNIVAWYMVYWFKMMQTILTLARPVHTLLCFNRASI